MAQGSRSYRPPSSRAVLVKTGGDRLRKSRNGIRFLSIS